MATFTYRVVVLAALVLSMGSAHAETYHREEVRIPMAAAGSRGLEALLVRPDAPGKYPLVLLSHGAPRNADDVRKMTPWQLYPQAVEFARRGWAAVVVMRRGYGSSGGHDVERTHSCRDPNYVESAETSARDLQAAIAALIQRPDIDGSRILAVGHSAGGLAAVALTAHSPRGLVAAINFAGGRGSQHDFEVCNEARLIAAFRTFGKTSRVPMLWVYAENDRFFKPTLAEKFHQAFAAAGGNVEFIKAAPFAKDGHQLFSLTGTAIWTPYVDAFLVKHSLTLRATPLQLPIAAALIPPQQLSVRGRQAFGFYRRAGPHKAFAITSDGHFGWQSARRTIDEAKTSALKFCREYGGAGCHVVFVDDAAAP